MTVGVAASLANTWLDGLDTMWLQLHTADPGAAGTTAVAGNTTRKQISTSAASGGAVTTDADLDWSDAEVTTGEDYTHWSLWSASSAGVFKGSGTITANAVNAAGDSFKIPAGDLDISLTVAA